MQFTSEETAWRKGAATALGIDHHTRRRSLEGSVPGRFRSCLFFFWFHLRPVMRDVRGAGRRISSDIHECFV